MLTKSWTHKKRNQLHVFKSHFFFQLWPSFQNIVMLFKIWIKTDDDSQNMETSYVFESSTDTFHVVELRNLVISSWLLRTCVTLRGNCDHFASFCYHSATLVLHKWQQFQHFICCVFAIFNLKWAFNVTSHFILFTF